MTIVMADYRQLADALSRDIASGRLRPGERLPPQRAFADAHGIAPSTATRVYGELVRRGEAVGEVGRGTFVRTVMARPAPALTEPVGASVDLELNVPILPEQTRLLGESLSALVRRPAALDAMLRPATVSGAEGARRVFASLLAQPGWTADPECVCLAGGGKQALAAAFSALVPAGHRMGVEALTYPVVKGLAARLGIQLVPIRMDARGLLPAAMAEAHRRTPMRAIYFQPALHNPLGITMPRRRLIELGAVLRDLGIVGIEDHVYSFLVPRRATLASIAPDQAVLVDSLSKRVSPGITVGLVLAPPRLVPTIATAVRSGAWGPTGFSLECGVRWIVDGTVRALGRAKRRDARTRQRLLRTSCAGLDVRSDPGSYHAWLTLGRRWRAEAFVAAALQQGIAVTPASAFAVGSGHAPNAVRLALASPALEVLGPALKALAALARAAPGPSKEPSPSCRSHLPSFDV